MLRCRTAPAGYLCISASQGRRSTSYPDSDLKLRGVTHAEDKFLSRFV